MRKTVVLLFCVLGAFALTYVLRTLYIVSYAPMRAFDRTGAPRATATAPSDFPLPTPTPSPSAEERLMEQADANFMEGRVNILLLGFDQSPERDEAGTGVSRNERNNYRSDVLLLLAVNFQKGTVHLISIPRDTYTPIYNTRGRWKINAVFAKGGAAEGEGFLYAQRTVEMLFGVPIDYYAGVNMEGLKKLVDAMGGVDYDVDVRITLNGRTLEEGMQHLDGQQVLDYCRARKGISTDVGRADRQQRMLLAIFRQLQSTHKLAALPSLYAAVSDDVYTNLSVPQIAALAVFALELDETSFLRTTLEGAYVNNVYNASYYVLENKKLIALVKQEFGITIKRDSKYDLNKVKRDKAAAEAARAAAALEEAEAMLTVPADATGTQYQALLDNARAGRSMLLTAIESGASETEIRRLRDLYMRDVSRLLRGFPLDTDMSGVPKPFRALVGTDGTP